MNDGVSVNIVGIPEFASRLQAFSMDMQRKTIRSADMAAAIVFRNAARANAPVSRIWKVSGHTPGLLKKSIYAGRSKTRSKPGIETYTVGARGGEVKRKNQFSAFYWRWVESGHLVRGPGQKLRGGDRWREIQRQRLRREGAKFVPPNAFLRRAFQTQQTQALMAFNKRLDDRIQRAKRELNVR